MSTVIDLFAKWRKRAKETRADRLASLMYEKRTIVNALTKWAAAFGDSVLKNTDDRFDCVFNDRLLSRQMTDLAVYQYSNPGPVSLPSSRLDIVCQIISSTNLELTEDSPTIAQILEFISSRAHESILLADEFKAVHLARNVIVTWVHRHHIARCERLLVQYRVDRDQTRMHDGFSIWALLLAQIKMHESNAVYHYSIVNRKTTISSLKDSLRTKRRNRSDAIVFSNYKLLLKYWTRLATVFETHTDTYNQQSDLLAATYHKTRVYKSVLMGLYDAVLSRKANVTESARIFLAAKQRRSFEMWRARARDGERVGVFESWRDELWVKGFFRHWVGVRRLVLRNEGEAGKMASRYFGKV
jgi:hypothetical protein